MQPCDLCERLNENIENENASFLSPVLFRTADNIWGRCELCKMVLDHILQCLQDQVDAAEMRWGLWYFVSMSESAATDQNVFEDWGVPEILAARGEFELVFASAILDVASHARYCFLLLSPKARIRTQIANLVRSFVVVSSMRVHSGLSPSRVAKSLLRCAIDLSTRYPRSWLLGC